MDNAQSWQASWLVAGVAIGMWSLPPQWRLSMVPKADHFFAVNTETPDWAKGSPLATIGDHYFYRAN